MLRVKTFLVACIPAAAAGGTSVTAAMPVTRLPTIIDGTSSRVASRPLGTSRPVVNPGGAGPAGLGEPCEI
jgi:hypothetical protein